MTRLDICSVLVTLLHIAILRKETRFNGQMQSNNCMNRMKKTRTKKTRNEKKKKIYDDFHKNYDSVDCRTVKLEEIRKNTEHILCDSAI